MFSISELETSVHLPVGVSLDLRANDQPSGVMEAQWGRRSSTGLRNCVPWGPHITNGLKRVSPGAKQTQLKMSPIHPSRIVTQYSITSTATLRCYTEDTKKPQLFKIYWTRHGQKTVFRKILNTTKAERKCTLCLQKGEGGITRDVLSFIICRVCSFRQGRF